MEQPTCKQHQNTIFKPLKVHDHNPCDKKCVLLLLLSVNVTSSYPQISVRAGTCIHSVVQKHKHVCTCENLKFSTWYKGLAKQSGKQTQVFNLHLFVTAVVQDLCALARIQVSKRFSPFDHTMQVLLYQCTYVVALKWLFFYNLCALTTLFGHPTQVHLQVTLANTLAALFLCY